MKPRLLPGTVVCFEGVHATVVSDSVNCFFVTGVNGGEPDSIERWEWELDGEECSIVSVPNNAQREALQIAEDAFRRYAHHHSLKGDMIKANENLKLADKMASALTQ